MYDLPPLLRATGQAPEIAALIRETIEPATWLDVYHRSGSGTIASSTDGRLVVSQSHDVHKRIQELLAKLGDGRSVSLPLEAPQETLMKRMEFLMSYRKQLEGELDRLQERQSQFQQERSERERQALEDALRATMNDLRVSLMDLQAIKIEPNGTHNEGLRRAIQRIEQSINRCDKTLARRTFTFIPDPLPLPDEWREEGTVASRISAKQRDLRQVSCRIKDIQRARAGTRAFNPELDRLLWAAKRASRRTPASITSRPASPTSSLVPCRSSAASDRSTLRTGKSICVWGRDGL